MQHISINYNHKPEMRWLTEALQGLLHLASNVSHEPTKKLVYGKIAELRSKSNGS